MLFRSRHSTNSVKALKNKLCAWRHNMPSPHVGAQGPCAPPSRRNVAVLSHAEYLSRSLLQLPYALRPSGLVTFDLESRVRVACDVGYLCQFWSS